MNADLPPSAPPITPARALEGWTTIEQSILVNAPAECVERLLVNFRSIYRHLQNVQFDEVFPDIGGVICYSVRLGSLAVLEVELKIVEWKRGFLLGDLAIHAVKLGTGGIAKARRTTQGMMMWRLQPDAHGTRVTVRYQYEQPSEYFEQILEQRVVRHLAAQNVERALHSIKLMAERGA